METAIELNNFILKLLIALFCLLAVLEWLHKGFVSYFFDIRIIFGLILITLILNAVLFAKKIK